MEDTFLDVGLADVVLASVVDWALCVLQTLLHVVNAVEHLVLHFDELQSMHCGRLVLGCHTGHQVSHVSNLLDRHGVLVLGDRQNAELAPRILSSGDCDNTR